MEQVILGKTGISVSRLAFGTGTNGWNNRSDQTALGLEGLADLLCDAYDRGVTFWDLADGYGSHPHTALALKRVKRDGVVILTKTVSRTGEKVAADVERFLKELGTDYLDVVLLHCVGDAEWPTKHADALETLTGLRERGVVRAVGVSTHKLDALRAAAADPWTEVLLARINYGGHHMDGPVDENVSLLKQAHASGKGVIGMKVLGQGKLTHDPEGAIRFAAGTGALHAITVGMVRREQVEENVRLVSGGW